MERSPVRKIGERIPTAATLIAAVTTPINNFVSMCKLVLHLLCQLSVPCSLDMPSSSSCRRSLDLTPPTAGRRNLVLIGVGGRPCGGSRFLWQRSAHQHWHPWYMPCTMLRHHAASGLRQRPPTLVLVPILACAVLSRRPNGCPLEPLAFLQPVPCCRPSYRGD